MSKKKTHQDDLDRFIKARGLEKTVNDIVRRRRHRWANDEFAEDGKLLDDAEL
jgi:hypothetical protein